MPAFDAKTWTEYLRGLYPEGEDIRQPALWGLAFYQIMQESGVPHALDVESVYECYTSGLTPRQMASDLLWKNKG